MRRKSKVAEKFWKTRCDYPPFIYNHQRRYIDLGVVLEHIDGVRSILDLGCGEGHILLMLRELTSIKEYYGYDLSSVFITNLIKRWGKYPGLSTKVADFTVGLPETDMSICMGVMSYIFDDNELKQMLSNIKSNIFICRVPCNLTGEKVEINKFSKEFNDIYAAVYRGIPEYISILSNSFNIIDINRCYPDNIESKYNSKQFFFICKRR